MSSQIIPQTTDPDFSICKLCGAPGATPAFIWGKCRLYRCAVCDLHYLDRFDPPEVEPPADEMTSSLTDQQLSYIDARLGENERKLSARLQLVQEFVDLTALRCLDIGTGVGQFLQMLTAAGADPCGNDPSRLRRNFARQRFDLELHPESVDEPFWQQQSGSFDLITLWDVLEHLNDPAGTIQAAFALLKPGGWLILETDNRDCVPYRLSCMVYRLTLGAIPLFLPHFYRPAPYGHKQIFRPGQLFDLARRCGFELIAASPGSTGISAGQIPRYRPRGQCVLVARKPA